MQTSFLMLNLVIISPLPTTKSLSYCQ